MVQTIERLLCSGLYYGPELDLTLWLQGKIAKMQQAQLQKNRDGSVKLTHVASSHFWWNRDMCLSMTGALEVDSRWFAVTVQGFVGIEMVQLGRHEARLALLSRRSRQRSGMRFNVRGIDDDGNVANFVETELLFAVDDQPWASFTQVRGSMPVFWTQTGERATEVTRDPELAAPAFSAHHAALCRRYGTVAYWNLCADRRPHEAKISRTLERVLQLAGIPQHSYVHFDYALRLKRGFSVAMDELGQAAAQALQAIGYHHVGQRLQSGVIRTNCMDCLDRTNAVQFCFALQWLSHFCTQAGVGHLVDLETQRTDEIFEAASEDSQRRGVSVSGLGLPGTRTAETGRSLRSVVQTLFATQGDAVARQYAGSGALNSSAIRNGKVSVGSHLQHWGRGVSRLVQNAFDRDTTDSAIGILQGRAKQQLRTAKTFGDRPLQLWVGTWNLGGAVVDPLDNLTEWLRPECGADIYVVGLQEMVDLNAKNILTVTGNVERQQDFDAKFWRVLRSMGEFVKVRSVALVGLYIAVFMRQDLSTEIRALDCDRVKTGAGGSAGNKGAVCVRFELGDFSFCFINLHLPAGQTAKNAAERNSDMRQVLHDAFSDKTITGATRRRKEGFLRQGLFTAGSSDCCVVLGDFNFRLNLVRDFCVPAIETGEWDTVKGYDQHLMGETGLELTQFQEGHFSFPPTYKFEVGTDRYDEKRTPAWCDRILYRGSLALQSYDSAPLKASSDHRPVLAVLSVGAREGTGAAGPVVGTGGDRPERRDTPLDQPRPVSALPDVITLGPAQPAVVAAPVDDLIDLG